MTLKEIFKPKKYYMCVVNDTDGNEYWINKPSGELFRKLRDREVDRYYIDLTGTLFCLIEKARDEE